MDDRSETLKTNEQIIEELTKDLESSCIRVDESKDSSLESETKTIKTDIPSDNCREHLQLNSDNGSNQCETEQDYDTNRSEDFADEDLLKDREPTLSESEKEIFKKEAEKCKNKGNESFKSGEYREAISMYTQGIRICPLAYSKERSILYANRAAAKIKCQDRESAVSDCTKAIELNPSYIKAYIRRAQLYEEADKLDEALEDYKKVLTFDPDHAEANYAVRRLPSLIHERNEKLKAEMLGKLKDLGNMVLKPFGLSTNNFELQKDPNSGGYSVKFHQNPS